MTTKDVTDEEKANRREKVFLIARSLWWVEMKDESEEARAQNWQETRQSRMEQARKLLRHLEFKGAALSMPENA